MNNFNFYTKTPPLRLYFKVALPGAISMVASSLWGLFDGIFVGQQVGDIAFAALNLAFPFVLINFALADLIGVGASVPISIALGKQDEKTANNYFTSSVLLIFSTGLLMGMLMYAIAPALMTMMGAEGSLHALSVRYIRVYALTSPLTTIMFAVDNYLRICGRIKSSMLLNIALSVIIFGLEALFLVVLDMGITGSPLAVSLGMIACVIMALYPFVRNKLTLRFVKPRLTLAMLRQIVMSGSPIFLSNVAARVTSILMNMALLHFGGANAVSVYGILLFAGDTLQQLLYGACDSLQPALGYNWGAGERQRVNAIGRCCLAAGAVISGAGVMVMMLFPQPIAALFMQGGAQEVLVMAAPAMRIFALTYITRWFGFSVQSFLIAVDRPLPATLLSVANALIFPVALLALLWPLKLTGLWLNTPITALLVSAMALLIIVRMQKKK